MKKIKFVFILVLFYGHAFGQEEKEADFHYETLQNIKKTTFVSAGIEPLAIGIQGSYLTLAAGLDLRLSNFKERFSADIHFGINYVNYSFDGNKLGFKSLDFDDKTAINFVGLLGYTIKQKKRKKKLELG